MTGLTPPPGVEARRPSPPGCVAEWVLSGGSPIGGLMVRLYAPTATAVARVEVTTTPARYGPSLTTEDDLVRLGREFAACTALLAPGLTRQPAAPAPEPQPSLFDHLEPAPAGQ